MRRTHTYVPEGLYKSAGAPLFKGMMCSHFRRGPHPHSWTWKPVHDVNSRSTHLWAGMLMEKDLQGHTCYHQWRDGEDGVLGTFICVFHFHWNIVLNFFSVLSMDLRHNFKCFRKKSVNKLYFKRRQNILNDVNISSLTTHHAFGFSEMSFRICWFRSHHELTLWNDKRDVLMFLSLHRQTMADCGLKDKLKIYLMALHRRKW